MTSLACNTVGDMDASEKCLGCPLGSFLVSLKRKDRNQDKINC